MDGGCSLDLIAIPTFMDLCHVCGPLFVSDLRRQGGWDGLLGPGLANTQRKGRELLPNESKVSSYENEKAH